MLPRCLASVTRWKTPARANATIVVGAFAIVLGFLWSPLQTKFEAFVIAAGVGVGVVLAFVGALGRRPAPEPVCVTASQEGERVGQHQPGDDGRETLDLLALRGVGSSTAPTARAGRPVTPSWARHRVGGAVC